MNHFQNIPEIEEEQGNDFHVNNEEVIPESDLTEPHTDENTPSEIIDNSAAHTDTTPCTSKKRGTKRYISEVTSVERAINKLQKISEDNRNSQQTCYQETEFDFFCKSLALQLKNMPLDRALMCQAKLQSVMTNERLSQMTMNYSLGNEIPYSMSHSPSHLSNNSSSTKTPDIYIDNDSSIGTPQPSGDLGNAESTTYILSEAINSIVDLE